jgi:hypothetical protein
MSPHFSLLGAASPMTNVTTLSRRVTFHSHGAKDELAASISSLGNTSSCCLPTRVETKALNLHHRHRTPSPDRLTLTLHYYKTVISTLATLSTTQLCLHFTSCLARAPHHRSSTRHYRSLSSLFHDHHPSV